ncbi:hypothetical protein QZH41_007731 [Actinostola sp. cb2023]|nr:hypothetical protein QZH41_007731 [Actinostola sp. cb2023]
MESMVAIALAAIEEEKQKEIEEHKKQVQIDINTVKYFESSISVCTVDNKCDVMKALPMMTGLFWYQINEMIFQRLCPQNCQSEECDYLGTFDKVLEDADRLISYAASLPSYWGMTWNNFYNDAVSGSAFTKLYVALSMVEEKEEALEISKKQCDLINLVAACPHDNFYQQYKLVKKIQRNQNIDIKVKDLREHSHIDYEQLVTLQKENLQHFELLGRINQLDDNMQASVSGISTFFEGLAKFDQVIASADAAFLKDSLDKYTTTLATVETKLTKDIKEAMTLMEVVLAANLAEEAAKLAALILANSNPLKLIFAGPDVMDVLDQSGKVANAAAELAHGIALFVALDDLTKDSLQLRRAFGSNAEQISTLQSVVDKIRNGQENDIGHDSEKFIEEYGAYTPQTDRSILAKNDALWSAFKDATCDVLNGEVGIAGSIPKGIAGGKLICERLEGTLAQFFTLREDIFDFQFQLVDSVAAVVRGNLAQRFARNIEGKHDVLEASQLMTGFFMMQSKIQKVTSVYCDVLEYKNLGIRVQPCSTVNGLFGKENIDALISYKDNTPYDQIERDVYIPTRAQSDGDTGVVDLQALARGETVIFQIPVDKNWLTEYGWSLPGQRSIPFIKSLKLFLPHKTYEDSSAQGYTTTQARVNIPAPSLSTNWRHSKKDLLKVTPTPGFQPAALDELKKANPNGRFWIKIDGTDIKEGLMESMKGKWNGDEDLCDGKAQQLREEYDKRIEPWEYVCGFSRETLIEVTTNIESQEARRRINHDVGYPEHPRAGGTDDLENFFAILHRLLGPIFTLKQFCDIWSKVVRKIVKV